MIIDDGKILVPQIAAANVSTPASGFVALFIDGSVLKQKDSSGTVTSLSGGSGMRLLAVQKSTNLNVTLANAFADISATEAFVTFTAPASGSVLIEAMFAINITTVTNLLLFNLRQSTNNVAGSGQMLEGITQTTGTDFSLGKYHAKYRFILTGLTSGTSYTYKLGGVRVGGTVVVKADDNATWGVFQMTAWEV